MSLEDIAKKHDVPLEDLQSQLAKGIEIELEHTTDRSIAQEIAMDHLFEDALYYDNLAQVEISEAKQRGTLYHYTPLHKLQKIVESNVLKAKDTPIGQPGNAQFKKSVSLTRDKNFHTDYKMIGGLGARIILDGDKLSENYKIVPYNDPMYSKKLHIDSYSSYEAEERIFEDIKSLDKYILGYDIFFKKAEDETQESSPGSEWFNKLKELLIWASEIPNVKFIDSDTNKVVSWSEIKQMYDIKYDTVVTTVAKAVGESLASIFEAKQVGTVYHFTSIKHFPKILDQNTLQARGQMRTLMGTKLSKKEKKNQPPELKNKPRGYGIGPSIQGFSTTRNKFLYKIPDLVLGKLDIRIALDGDKLSEHYKIRPWNDFNFDRSKDEKKSKWGHTTQPYYEESEEIVYTTKPGENHKDLVNLDKYVLTYDVLLDQIEKNYSISLNIYVGDLQDINNTKNSKIRWFYKEKQIEFADWIKSKIKQTDKPEIATFNDAYVDKQQVNEALFRPSAMRARAREDYKKNIKEVTKYALKKNFNIRPLPACKFVYNNLVHANDPLGRTAHYDPNNHCITLYTLNRHPKDILRSYCHELIHHMQNVEDRLHNITTTNINKDDALKELEREAYEKGNMLLREWENSIKQPINESPLEDNHPEIKWWAIYSNIWDKLKKDPETVYQALKPKISGEALKALEYFYPLAKDPSLLQEAKQRGDLYHFTSPLGIVGILTSGTVKGNNIDRKLKDAARKLNFIKDKRKKLSDEKQKLTVLKAVNKGPEGYEMVWGNPKLPNSKSLWVSPENIEKYKNIDAEINKITAYIEKTEQDDDIGAIFAVSLTRDKNLHKKDIQIGGTSVRITLDGDKLSEHYKIIPFKDQGYSIKGHEYAEEFGYIRDTFEAEERLIFNKREIPILGYIKSVDILDKYAVYNTDEIYNLCKKHNIPFNEEKVISEAKYFSSKEQQKNPDIKTCIAVCFKEDKLLVGKSTSNDDRKGLWVFPGGGWEPNGETLNEGAVRELGEETGIKATAEGEAILTPPLSWTKCTYKGGTFNPNNEFSELQWIDPKDLGSKYPTLPNNKKILAQFMSSLNEAKQVGTVYHFTSALGVYNIIKTNTLKSQELDVIGRLKPYKDYKFISLTRDKNFHIGDKMISGMSARIVLDGNKLSEKYKIIPFRYFRGRSKLQEPQKYDESEERLVLKGDLTNLDKYVLSYDLFVDKFHSSLILNMLETDNPKIRLFKDGKLVDKEVFKNQTAKTAVNEYKNQTTLNPKIWDIF
jgi:8-oxo-dGTP pyrophosphatase MutT (NUDIX family)